MQCTDEEVWLRYKGMLEMTQLHDLRKACTQMCAVPGARREARARGRVWVRSCEGATCSGVLPMAAAPPGRVLPRRASLPRAAPSRPAACRACRYGDLLMIGNSICSNLQHLRADLKDESKNSGFMY